MCKYQKINHLGNKKIVLPICSYTKNYCTYCIYANSDTFIKAETKENIYE